LLLGVRLGLLLNLGDGLGLLLLKLLRQGFLNPGSLHGHSDSVFLVDLLVLGQAVLQLGKLGLQGGFLEKLGFLVGIDDLGGNEIVEAFARVLGSEGIGFGSVRLRNI
jgi:hypothetical protein